MGRRTRWLGRRRWRARIRRRPTPTLLFEARRRNLASWVLDRVGDRRGGLAGGEHVEGRWSEGERKVLR